MIDDLQIRIPGMNEEEGQRIGRQVAQLVGEKFPVNGAGRQLNAIEISYVTQPGMSEDHLANALAEQIIQQLRLALT